MSASPESVLFSLTMHAQCANAILSSFRRAPDDTTAASRSGQTIQQQYPHAAWLSKPRRRKL
jgi:hypothetical protein